MSTIADAMDAATGELRACRVAMDALRGQVTDQLGAKTTQAQTVINSFLAATVSTVYVDPINGNDANDGKTYAAAKKTVEAVTDAMGSAATAILLFGDYVFRHRNNVYASLSISGARVSGNARGWDYQARTVGFLGQADGSPVDGIGSFCSGLWLLGPNVSFNYITFALPAQPAGQSFPAHFSSSTGCSANFQACTVTVADQTAGYLFGASNASAINFTSAIGSGAAGHILQGVAAGGNPNSLWNYRSNITSA